jgi:hypothetical protein
VNLLVLSGTAPLVPSGTGSSCYRELKFPLAFCQRTNFRDSNFTNRDSNFFRGTAISGKSTFGERSSANRYRISQTVERGFVAGLEARQRDIRRRPQFQAFAFDRTEPCSQRAKPPLSFSPIWRTLPGYSELVRKRLDSPLAPHSRSACGLQAIGRRRCAAKGAAAICRSIRELLVICRRSDNYRTETKTQFCRRSLGSCAALGSPTAANRTQLRRKLSPCGRSARGGAP